MYVQKYIHTDFTLHSYNTWRISSAAVKATNPTYVDFVLSSSLTLANGIAHLSNSLFILVVTLLTDMPVRLLHFIYPPLHGVVYILPCVSMPKPSDSLPLDVVENWWKMVAQGSHLRKKPCVFYAKKSRLRKYENAVRLLYAKNSDLTHQNAFSLFVFFAPSRAL